MSDVERWENFRYEIVPLDRLFVDKEYQRRLTGLVREIRDDFIPPLMQTLCVSARKERREGGEMRVVSGATFDGQNRLEGAREHNKALDRGADVKGPRAEAAPCIVYSGLSQAEEAQLFEWIQTRRRNAQSYDRFKAALVAGNEESLTIKDLVENAGYEVGYAGMTDYSLSAVAALESMYRTDPFAMERTLIVFREAWKKTYLPSGRHLKGVARFLRDNPDTDDEKLIRRMAITSPDELEKKEISAAELREGRRSDSTMADAVRAVYGIREARVQSRLRSS